MPNEKNETEKDPATDPSNIMASAALAHLIKSGLGPTGNLKPEDLRSQIKSYISRKLTEQQ